MHPLKILRVHHFFLQELKHISERQCQVSDLYGKFLATNQK